MRRLTTGFKALSDETRLQMLALLLEERELCVCDFVEVLQITQSKASRHLRHLVHAGLLDDRREAVWVYFRLASEPDPVAAALIRVLPELLAGRIPGDLFQRLYEWNAQKQRNQGSCAAGR